MRHLSQSRRILLAAVVFVAFGARAGAAEPAPTQRLVAVLDGMDVEHHWLPGQHIKNWRTGVVDDKPLDGQPHTHCSAFVSAVSEKLNVPLLSPPPQTNLANRQRDWLLNEGLQAGWKRVSSAAAQQAANRGQFVLASFKNDDKDYHGGHGHIAVVRPTGRGMSATDGPTLTQAGGHNYDAVSTKKAFGRSWDRHEVWFFAFTK